MHQKIIFLILLATLTGCALPFSARCTTGETFQAPSIDTSANQQYCDEVDAVIYLISALYLEAQKEPDKEQTITTPNVDNNDCSNLVGKAQKECQRRKMEAYEPLDEL